MKYFAFGAVIILSIQEGLAKDLQKKGLPFKCFVPGQLYGNPDGDFLTDLARAESYYTYPMLPETLNYYTSEQTGKLLGLSLDMAYGAREKYTGEIIGIKKSDRGTTIVKNSYNLAKNPFDTLEFVFDSYNHLCNVGFWLDKTKSWLIDPEDTWECDEHSGKVAFTENSLEYPIVGLHGFSQYEALTGIGAIHLRQDLPECKKNSVLLEALPLNKDGLEDELKVSDETYRYGEMLEEEMLKTFKDNHTD